ncbi:MAG: tetratricopeptide repeat protein, partial [Oscillospiraceae bacterium]|nr:tetratricopeptide repeat protein [Oscillospiraceae bacterium]
FSSDIKTTLVNGCQLTEDGFKELSVDEQFIKIKNHLESLTEKTLLMIDINEGEPTDLENLPGNDNIKILFTTRNEQHISAEKIKIENLSYEDLKKIFEKNAEEKIRKKDKSYLEEFVTKILKYNTMVITLAAKTKLNSDKTMGELYDILVDDRLGEEIKEIFKHGETVDVLTVHILKLFSLGIVTEKEYQLLKYMSLIDYDGVYKKTLKKWIKMDDFNTLNALKNGGWVNYSENENGEKIVSMHPVISDAVFKQTEPTSTECSDFLVGIFEEDYEESPHKYFYLIRILEFIIKRFENEETKDIEYIYNQLGYLCIEFGEYDKALEYYFKSLEIKEKVLGKDHPNNATLYNGIGSVYNYKSEYDKALEYYFKALGIFEKVLGKAHPDTATLYNNIGVNYRDKGEYDKALEYHFKALEFREKVLGKDLAATYSNIGSVYNDKGEYDKALNYYEKASEIFEKVLDKAHPNAAIPYNNIGSVYYNKDEYDKALEYNFKALSICEKVLDKDHPSNATLYNNIGAIYKNKGEYDKALEYYEKTLKIREKVLGKDHPDTATSYNNIGGAYYSKGEYDKALEYYLKDLEFFEKVLGEKHPYTIITYRNIAGCYLNMGDKENGVKYAKLAGLIE